MIANLLPSIFTIEIGETPAIAFEELASRIPHFTVPERWTVRAKGGASRSMTNLPFEVLS